MRKPPKSPDAPRYPFFMSLRDIAFWARSARTDAALARYQKEHGSQEAFDKVYSQRHDPWGYLTPHFRYQNLKYAKIKALLPSQSFQSALDMGCGLGVFSRLLAPHAESVHGVELSAVAVEQAQELSAQYPNICYEQAELTQFMAQNQTPKYDLVALLDVLYYLPEMSDSELKNVVQWVESVTYAGGSVLLANHYFFDLDPQSRGVKRIHTAFQWGRSLRLVAEERHPFFLSSLLKKEDTGVS